jgi:hypothetical protein
MTRSKHGENKHGVIILKENVHRRVNENKGTPRGLP